ncbi:UTP--glucose-1-phosphate uridylyltransferase [Ornithinimicrobium pekingense]|uniref:UTP--glucose-1-phosphate uridylyltransferase n=1 Tax=Ornithinimicrobium pekingense TaxID=384677 RepID=A0ABQ2F7D8_9MICO|nr:UTP--glucose-1-phosphate uridylyltransferase [Ornithinimicrobium pekingense]GGK60417.1 UTP--glucose-1-phosphate uridylyltransferase [Ornithinimicrobium pekingense]
MTEHPVAPGLAQALELMTDAGVARPAREAFARHYRDLEEGVTGIVRESTIAPLQDPPLLADVNVDPEAQDEALARTAVVRLNGGLGTSMGLSAPKSLLPVRGELTFLDLAVRQVLALRERTGARLPLIFLDSFSTRRDTLAHLERYPELAVDDLPVEVLQSQEPKLREDDLTPVSWPADPRLEWCPPGHGDLYPALFTAGLVDRLLDSGFDQLLVANIDNVGAVPDGRVAGWFAQTGAGYAAEVCPRTPMDRKGGHLARRRSDGRLVLRDTAQTAEEEMHLFTDETRHPWVHCNNLWFRLDRLRDLLAEHGGSLPLPVIRNRKTVDPTDSGSTPVVQVESAMGGAVELVDDAVALGVTRERFLPVKTTNELMLLRSDVYELTDDLRLDAVRTPAPVVTLAKEHYGHLGDFDARLPSGMPSLREARSLTVEGDWTFGRDVTVRGDVTLGPEGGSVEDGAVLDGTT